MNLIVSTSAKILSCNGKTYPCAIGKGGAGPDKIEGDGKTPTGTFPLQQLYYRKDKLELPKLQIAATPIQPDDGWCDDVNNAKYNQKVKLPFPGRHENLWREDNVYDLVLVIGYNTRPILRGKGSAIFLHCAKPDYAPTEGCVALSHSDYLEILPQLTTGGMIEIR